MKKNFKFYIIVWGLFVALFNLVSFIIPADPETVKYTSSFWIGYSFVMLSFAGQFVCAFVSFKHDEHKRVFYNISLLQVSFIALATSLVAGILCMSIAAIPYWIATVICSVVLILNVIAVIKAGVAIDAVVRVDAKIKAQTLFIKSLTVDAETLMSRASEGKIKEDCHKVFEAIRYSDPMSNEAIASLESQITLKFASLSDAVVNGDVDTVGELAKEVCILVADRNRKCKLLK